ncbi:hypothetical protein D1647_15560 [Alistipes sp. Z76]|nr:hypothetical protein [Alistipes sp. Z76]NCE69661.1 hypothetical protein [Muribaculaceae bacterium M3]
MSAVRGALLSANANNGAAAGFGYLNANNRSSNSNANSGFRFYRGFNFTKIFQTVDRRHLTSW